MHLFPRPRAHPLLLGNKAVKFGRAEPEQVVVVLPPARAPLALEPLQEVVLVLA